MKLNQGSKVTLITIYYNRPNNVNDSLRSLFDQTYKNLDVIIYDDCSNDDTYEKLNAVVENRPNGGDHLNVKLIGGSKNSGFVRSLKNIIDNIDSEYVAVHGSGDISFPERVSEQAEYLDNNPNVGVVSNWTQVFDSTSGEYRNGKTHSRHISTDYLTKENPIAHGSVMFRLSDYKKVGGYRDFFTFGQDRDLWLRMSLISEVHVIPKVLYAMNKPSNTVSRDINKKIIQLMLTAFAAQMVVMRQKRGHDLIDLYGEKAGLFFNPVVVSQYINKLMLLQFFQNKEENMAFMMDISRTNNPSLLNKVFLKVVRGMYQVLPLRTFLQKLLKLRLNNRVLNDHESISDQ